jgi:hypothetical protein
MSISIKTISLSISTKALPLFLIHSFGPYSLVLVLVYEILFLFFLSWVVISFLSILIMMLHVLYNFLNIFQLILKW